jgi:septum formation protein
MIQGFRPEIIPSTFAEDLPKGSFEGRLADYPIATAGEKASAATWAINRWPNKSGFGGIRTIAEREWKWSSWTGHQWWAWTAACSNHRADCAADTVVIFPPEKDTAEGGKHEGEISEILEKPVSRADQVGYASLLAYRLW